MPLKRKIKSKRTTKTQNSKQINKHKLVNLMLSFLAITLMVSIGSYFFMPTQHEKKHTNTKSNIEKEFNVFNKNKTIKYEEPIFKEPNINAFEEYTKEFEKDYSNVEEIKKDIIRIIEDTKEAENKIVKKIEEITNNTDKSNENIKRKKDIIIDKRPKLAIVIDDVTLQSQINRINNIGYNITMSFMPPTPAHKDSAKIAQKLEFYMIHFPMQANSFKFEESNTLHIGDSYEKIEKRVKQIRAWYPNAKYTNNHTGSKFTADETSMDYLLKALKKYDFIFVDSRTTAHTVGRKYATKYDVPFLARNIFLDNQLEYKYIQTQLKKAIDIAKKSGYSIAIGHPHPITLKVLKESKHLLKGLNLVYIDKMPTS